MVSGANGKMAPGGPGMKVPEKFVRSRRKSPDRDVDGVMGQHDDFKFEVVAFKFFRMVVVVENMQDDRLMGRHDQGVRRKNMFFQMKDIGGGIRRLDDWREKEGSAEKSEKTRDRQSRPDGQGEKGYCQCRPG